MRLSRSRATGVQQIEEEALRDEHITEIIRSQESSCRFTWTITRPRRSIRACWKRCCRTSPTSSGTRPAAIIAFGWAAEEGVETARAQIAKLIGATTKEIIFTSGATESDNLAIKGVAEMYREKGNHIITAVTEHKAVLDTCKRLEKYGYRVTYLPVMKDGLIDLDDLKRAMDDKTILVTIMAANNEIGVIQPVEEIGKLCRERGVIFHTDAVQAVGKVPFDVNKLNVDIASISGHKIYGPKGVGALYVRRKNPRVQLSAQIDGGGHERGMRSGTLNVPGIVGLGTACEICNDGDGQPRPSG